MGVLHSWKPQVHPNNIKEFSSHLTENIGSESPQHPDWLWGPPSLLSGYSGPFLGEKAAGTWCWLSISNAELRIPGAIPPFPHTRASLYLIEHRDNFYIRLFWESEEVHRDAVAIMRAVWCWNKWCGYTSHWNLRSWMFKIDKAFHKKESPYFLWYDMHRGKTRPKFFFCCVYICCLGNCCLATIWGYIHRHRPRWSHKPTFIFFFQVRKVA